MKRVFYNAVARMSAIELVSKNEDYVYSQAALEEMRITSRIVKNMHSHASKEIAPDHR